MTDVVVRKLLQEMCAACENDAYPNAVAVRAFLDELHIEYGSLKDWLNNDNDTANCVSCAQRMARRDLAFEPPEMAKTRSQCATELLQLATDAFVASPSIPTKRVIDNDDRTSAFKYHDGARACTNAYDAAHLYADALASIDAAHRHIAERRLKAFDTYICVGYNAILMATNATQDALVRCLCGDVNATSRRDINRMKAVLPTRLIGLLGCEKAGVLHTRLGNTYYHLYDSRIAKEPEWRPKRKGASKANPIGYSKCNLIKVELIAGDPNWELIRKMNLRLEHQCCRVECEPGIKSMDVQLGDRVVSVNGRWVHGRELEAELKRGSRDPSMPITMWILRCGNDELLRLRFLKK